MRIAVIDLGTNTFHLLIGDISNDGVYKKVFGTRAVVKLGQGGINNNVITEMPFRRGVKTIIHFKEHIAKYKAERIFAFATSAIRNAKNGDEFIKAVKSKTGIQIKKITGDEEATFIYYGVRQCVDLGVKPSLIIDIGGGSTEFIIANNKKIFWKQSFDIGASRLLEKFKPSDLITLQEQDNIQDYLDNVLTPLKNAVSKYPVSELVGSSGSFDTLAEVIGFRFYGKNPIKDSTTYKFNLMEYHKVHELLLKSTTAQRKKMKGLISMRVDMIVVASICINYVLKEFKLEEMTLSKYALKEGAMWKIANNIK